MFAMAEDVVVCVMVKDILNKQQITSYKSIL